MKILTSFFMMLSFVIFNNDNNEYYIKVPSEVQKFAQNEDAYMAQARRIIRKELIQDYPFNSFTARSFLKDAKLVLIPMFEVIPSDDIDYSNAQSIIGKIRLNRKMIFSEIILYNEDKPIGWYACNDIGSCGLVLEMYMPGQSMILYDKIGKILQKEYDAIFNIRGLPWALWIIESDSLKVFSFINDAFYSPDEFLKKHYAPKDLKRIFEFVDAIK